MLHAFHVDFNTLSEDDERVSIPTHVHPDLLEFLQPGLHVVLREPFDFEVEAIADYDGTSESWYARPDWSTMRSLESPTLHHFRELEHRLLKLRDAPGDRPDEAVLLEEWQRLWGSLTDEEQKYLHQFPQYGQFQPRS